MARLPRIPYETELLRLQRELVHMQEWVRTSGARLVVIFEGRDAAGKGGAITRWEDYSRAKDEMFAHTDTPTSPWFVVEAEDKRRARINMIAHLLGSVAWEPTKSRKLKLPKRPRQRGYERPPRERFHEVPDHAETLTGK